MKTKVTKEQISEFKLFWADMYGDVDTKLTNSIFELFLKKYNNNIQKTADELNEFCKRYDDPKNEIRGGCTREQEIEGDLWI